MVDEKRLESRTPLNFKVKLAHPSFGISVVTMRDMSQTGIFVEIADLPVPSVGMVMSMQMQGLALDAPILKVEVARVTTEGFALRLCETLPNTNAADD